MSFARDNIDFDRLREEIQADEGTGPRKNNRFLLYKCPADRWTIGYGRNLQDRGITDATAMQMLNEDIAIAVAELTARIYWFDALPGTRKRILINMHFNLGIERLMGFEKFLEAARAGDHETAAVELLDSKAASVDAPMRYLRLAQRWRVG
jgi:lysozyme